MEDPTGYEPATSGTWPDTDLAGTAMMKKLEQYDEDDHEDNDEDKAVLCL